MKKKIVVTVFLTAALAMILFFAFQTPESSLDLSEAVRLWPEQIGAGTTAVVYVMVKEK